ncbi:MAG: hypothetical protein AAF533_18220 [Acidobacteriota bacterium]
MSSYEITTVGLLPDAAELKRRCRALALLDAILMPEWEWRYFSFDATWAPDEDMASMRDGEGGATFLHFSPAGVAGKIVHESVQRRGELDDVPACFASFKEEPAFGSEAGFYLWQERGKSTWMSSPAEASAPLLGFVVGQAAYYAQWARDYYERDVDETAVRRAWETLSVSADELEQLGSERTLEDLADDLREILGG